MTDPRPISVPGFVNRWDGRIARGLAFVAGTAVLLTLADPGITIDEPLDVRPGRAYLSALRDHGFRFLTPPVVDLVYRDNKEHPPLGRWALGLASTLIEPAEVLLAGPDPLGLYVLSGRVAPALVFAGLVWLVTRESGRRFGTLAGFAAGFSLIAMPRVFSHAHIAALDLFIAAAWTLAFLRAERALVGPDLSRKMAFAGLFWGLALLTKIQAWLLPPVVLGVALVRWGPRRSFVPLLLWTVVGLVVFFLGWPWLWADPVGRLRGYLGTGVDRVSIAVRYFGRVYRDRDVPWHFPWVYLASTVPIGLQVLGLIGLARVARQRDWGGVAIVGAATFVLAFFSTNVPIYDGERLFLLVFPLWSILIGAGFASAWRWSCRWRSSRLLLGVILVAQLFGTISSHPFGLSYYNLALGGLPGAQRLGMELAYWTEAVDPQLLRELALRIGPNEVAALAPTLAPQQGLLMSGRSLVRRGFVLGDEDRADSADWVIVSRREAYWKPELRSILHEGEVVVDRSRQGVWLARLLRRGKRPTPPGQSSAGP